MSSTLQNWAESFTYRAARLHTPKSLAELQDVVRSASNVKALGTRHSFNRIADTSADLISLCHFDQIAPVNPEQHTVRLGAGVTYGALARQLQTEGYALHNLASLPHISVVGACATATHGSGDANGNLATAVRSIEWVDADGELQRRTRGDQEFPGVVVNLGAIGVVTGLELDVVPAFSVKQHVFRNLPLQSVLDHFDGVMGQGYSVSLFTDWQTASINQLWIKLTDGEPDGFGAEPADRSLHMISTNSPDNCTDQLGVAGPWHERLPHFKMEFTPSNGAELQSEYLIPRQFAAQALEAVSQLGALVGPVLFISEVRTIAADDLWMSPCYRQPCVGIHFTWRRDQAAVEQILPTLEAALDPFDARPHWGKLFAMDSAQIARRFERLPDFQRLRQRFDARGKFKNEFLDSKMHS